MTKTGSCLSTTDQVNGRGTVAEVCQALHIQSRASGSVKLGLCRVPSCAGISFTVAMALPCQSHADMSLTVAMALSCPIVM